MNILLVDDNEEYLNFLKESLFRNGYDVLTASDGSEACAILARADIDLIISDIKMPTLDGIMLHAYARETEQHSRTKFIFISGFQGTISEVVSLEPSIDFFLDKTTPLSDMLKFIDELMFGSFAGTWV